MAHARDDVPEAQPAALAVLEKHAIVRARWPSTSGASLGSAAAVHPGSAMLWQPELGIHARAEARLGARWLIGLQLAAAAVPGSATFIVADTGAHRTLSKFDAISSISLAFRAF